MAAESVLSGLPPSVNVIKIELPFDLSLDDYIFINLKQIETMVGPDTPIAHQRVTLGNVDAEELEYEMTMTGVAGDVTGKITQYLILDGQTAYVVTIVCLSEFAADYAPTFKDIGTSFRLLDGP